MIKKDIFPTHMADSSVRKDWAQEPFPDLPTPQILKSRTSSTVFRSIEEIRLALTEEALELQKILAAANIQISLSNNPFHTLNNIEKGLDILSNLQTRTEIARTALEHDIDLNDNRGLFWMTCRRFNLKPLGSFIDLIHDEDILEVYNVVDGYKQIASNFKFWTMVSYPIDFILTHDFDELYERDGAQISIAIEGVSTCIKSQQTHGFDPEPHSMKERLSEKRYEFLTTFRHVSPLVDRISGSCNAIVSTIKARRV